MTPTMWSFRLLGGEPVAIKMKFVSVEHDGHLSLWNLWLTVSEAQALEDLLIAQEIRVTRWSEVPSVEAQKERETLLQAQRGEVSYLTLQCPSCFWMDLNAEDKCGLRMWHKTTRDEALRMYEKARTDAWCCPLLK